MIDAPDKITVSSHGFSFEVKADYIRAFKDQEYIRADIHYELKLKCGNWIDSLGLANIELSENILRIAELENDLAVANELLDHYRSEIEND